MNKDQNQKIVQIENLISQAKLELKTWASQISKYHKALKELTSQVETIKSELNMTKNKNPDQNQPKPNNK